METFSKILDELFEEINSITNEKNTGVSFLELLKFALIEKLRELDQTILEELKKTLLSQDSIEKKSEVGNRSIIYTIKYFHKSESVIKKKSTNDCLYITIDGLKIITVFDKNTLKKSILSNLSRNMGIVLSQDTLFNVEFTKKSIVIFIISN